MVTKSKTNFSLPARQCNNYIDLLNTKGIGQVVNKKRITNMKYDMK